MSERNVLLKNVKHPFLVGLHFSFQTADKLYFVLDYINGGEVSWGEKPILGGSLHSLPGFSLRRKFSKTFGGRRVTRFSISCNSSGFK
jgi:serine/threonine protein kinase